MRPESSSTGIERALEDALEDALKELRGASVPDDLCDAVMARVKRERRFFGLGGREWAVIGAAFGSFAVALQVIVTWASERWLTF